MSVTEYHREFTRFSKYAPDMLVTEEEKCRKFDDFSMMISPDMLVT